MRISDWSSDVCSSDLRDHKHVVDQRQYAASHPPALCHHQGCGPELHWRPSSVAGREEDPGHCVAPGPVWTPLILSTMPPEAVKEFGQNTPLGRDRKSTRLNSSH